MNAEHKRVTLHSLIVDNTEGDTTGLLCFTNNNLVLSIDKRGVATKYTLTITGDYNIRMSSTFDSRVIDYRTLAHAMCKNVIIDIDGWQLYTRRLANLVSSREITKQIYAIKKAIEKLLPSQIASFNLFTGYLTEIKVHVVRSKVYLYFNNMKHPIPLSLDTFTTDVLLNLDNFIEYTDAFCKDIVEKLPYIEGINFYYTKAK